MAYTTSATGTDYWVATYSGDANNASSSSSCSGESVSVTPAGTTRQTITFGTAPPAPGRVVGGSGSVSATASSGLPVTLTVASESNGVCSITSDGTGSATVSYDAAGSCVIDANQSGDSTYRAAAQKTQTFTIKLNPQAITFGAAPPVTGRVVGGSGTVSATASSGLPVTLSVASGSSGVCSITSGGLGSATVSYDAAGSCVIDANQSGDGTYWAAARQRVLRLTVRT